MMRYKVSTLAVAVCSFAIIMMYGCTNNAQNRKTNTEKESEPTMKDLNGLQQATLGAGCFWCVEAVYKEMKGVVEVTSGYTGGDVENPTYKQICTGTTGHAEVAQVTFDPKVTSYEEILEVFWRTHDPTTLNRQGNDSGTQYRSVIYYHNDEQKHIAESSMQAAVEAKLYDDPIVTEISALGVFYQAEDYHQDYYEKNPNQPYCHFVVGPKVEKFKKLFKDKLKEK